jgi:hypothetical protein
MNSYTGEILSRTIVLRTNIRYGDQCGGCHRQNRPPSRCQRCMSEVPSRPSYRPRCFVRLEG